MRRASTMVILITIKQHHLEDNLQLHAGYVHLV